MHTYKPHIPAKLRFPMGQQLDYPSTSPQALDAHPPRQSRTLTTASALRVLLPVPVQPPVVVHVVHPHAGSVPGVIVPACTVR